MPTGETRNRILILRLLESEEVEIEAAAKAADKTKSDFVREVVLEAAKARKREPRPTIAENMGEAFLD